MRDQPENFILGQVRKAIQIEIALVSPQCLRGGEFDALELRQIRAVRIGEKRLRNRYGEGVGLRGLLLFGLVNGWSLASG